MPRKGKSRRSQSKAKVVVLETPKQPSKNHRRNQKRKEKRRKANAALGQLAIARAPGSGRVGLAETSNGAAAVMTAVNPAHGVCGVLWSDIDSGRSVAPHWEQLNLDFDFSSAHDPFYDPLIPVGLRWPGPGDETKWNFILFFHPGFGKVFLYSYIGPINNPTNIALRQIALKGYDQVALDPLNYTQFRYVGCSVTAVFTGNGVNCDGFTAGYKLTPEYLQKPIIRTAEIDELLTMGDGETVGYQAVADFVDALATSNEEQTYEGAFAEGFYTNSTFANANNNYMLIDKSPVIGSDEAEYRAGFSPFIQMAGLWDAFVGDPTIFTFPLPARPELFEARVIHCTGIHPLGSLQFKTCEYMQCKPDTNSAVSPLAVKAPRHDPSALEVYSAIMRDMPAAFCAAANASNALSSLLHSHATMKNLRGGNFRTKMNLNLPEQYSDVMTAVNNAHMLGVNSMSALSQGGMKLNGFFDFLKPIVKPIGELLKPIVGKIPVVGPVMKDLIDPVSDLIAG